MRIMSFWLVMLLALGGCSSKVISYQSSNQMTLNDAILTTEELIMTQHENWRPDSFTIRNDYMLWGYGAATSTSGIATSFGYGVAYGTSKAVTRDIGNRVYYKNIKDVQLMTWSRKFKEWYVVSLIKTDGLNDSTQHIYYTRNQDSAKRLVDSLNIIRRELLDPANKIGLTETAKSGESTDERLISLKALYEQGLITEAEYHTKRQEILDSI